MSTVHLDDERAQRLLDGTIPAAERAACDAHLACCPDCCGLVDSYRALGEALDALEAPEAPAGFTEGVMCCIEAAEAAAVRERRLAAGILSAAAAGVAVLLVAGGQAAWVPVLARAGDLLGGAATWATLAASVLEPVVRALRLEIIIATAGASLPLLLALRRLAPRRAEAVL